MFVTQNLGVSLLPCSYIFTSCPFNTYIWPCGYGYHTYCHNVFHTYVTIQTPPNPCLLNLTCGAPPSIVPVGGGGGEDGDPVAALQALRRQLEVALAGVRAQEEELRRQRAAAGGGA